MPRFAILEHDWPTLHWDFLLEAGAVARTWRLLAEPTMGSHLLAEASADHRLLYLEYEGAVSGGRGTVRRWDAGTFDWLADEPTRIEVDLEGNRLAGLCVIAMDARGNWWVAFDPVTE